MKRILSLLLVMIMVVSMIPAAFATRNYDQGTDVTYDSAADDTIPDGNGDGKPDNQEYYTVTVPAKMAPGEEGTVTLAGTWASNRVVTVGAEDTVRLTNSINSADYKDLAITFVDMVHAGNNTTAKSYTGKVSVAAMPADALFGTWSGTFAYTVAIADAV